MNKATIFSRDPQTRAFVYENQALRAVVSRPMNFPERRGWDVIVTTKSDGFFRRHWARTLVNAEKLVTDYRVGSSKETGEKFCPCCMRPI